MSMEEGAVQQAAANTPLPPQSDVANPAAEASSSDSASTPWLSQPATAVAVADKNNKALLQQVLALSSEGISSDIEVAKVHSDGGRDLTEKEIITWPIKMSMCSGSSELDLAHCNVIALESLFVMENTQHIEVRAIRSCKVLFMAIYTLPCTVKAPWNHYTDADTDTDTGKP